MLVRVGIPIYQNLLSVSRQIVCFIHLMASYLFADIAFHWKIRPLHAFFVCLFIFCLSREITQPPLRRPVSSVGSVSKDVLTMMTDRDKSRAAQNKMRRHWVPRGICTNHVFLGRLTATLK